MNKTYQRINWQNEPSIATPLNEVNLNKVDYSLNEVDNRIITLDTSKADQSDLLQTVKAVTYNTTTGVFTFTFWNGTVVTADLNIEKIPVSFSMSPQGVITMTTADGTQYTADVSELIKTYSFVDSSEIDFTVTTDSSGNKSVTASIIAGSITGEKLQPNFLADCQTAKNQAESAAGSASSSATSSELSSEDSEAWAVGTRDGVPVPSTDPAYENNAKWWAQHGTGSSFAGLSDTNFTNLQNGQIAKYNSTTQKWENAEDEGGLLPHFKITSEAGSTVTVVCPDTSVITPTQTSSGIWQCDVPAYGVYTVHAVINGDDSVRTVTVDTVKEYVIHDEHYSYTLNVYAPTGSSIIVTDGDDETYTGTGAGSTAVVFALHQASTTYTITVTYDGLDIDTTITSSATTGGSGSKTIEFGTINLTLDEDLIGETITMAKGLDTVSKVASSTSMVFYPNAIGNWTISCEYDGETYYSEPNPVVVSSLSTAVSAEISLVHIPEGATVTPTDDIQTWLACANITDKSYTTLAEVLADRETFETLIADSNACDYMARSTSWASSDGEIPVMTSDTTPNDKGVCIGTTESAPPATSWYKAFDNDASTSTSVNASNGVYYVGYKFETPVIINMFEYMAVNGGGSYLLAFTYKIEGSNDESTWTSLYESSFTQAEHQATQTTPYIATFNNTIAYKCYRLSSTNSNYNYQSRFVVGTLQFYKADITHDQDAMALISKYDYCCTKLLNNSVWAEAISNSDYFEEVLNVCVPLMTSNTTPSGECFGSGTYNSSYYYAFDGVITMAQGWASQNDANDKYVGYEFTTSAQVRKVTLWTPASANNNELKTFKVQYYNENNEWVDATEVLTYLTATQSSAFTKSYVVNTTASSTKWRLLVLTNIANNNIIRVCEAQFYGRASSNVSNTNGIIHTANGDTVTCNGNTYVADTNGIIEIDFSDFDEGTYTFTSSIAKNPDNLSQDYTKQFRITKSPYGGTTELYLMPDAVKTLYWWGYEGNIEDCISANGWSYSSGSITMSAPTHNTDNIYFETTSNVDKAFGSKSPITGTVNTIIQAVSVNGNVSVIFNDNTAKVVKSNWTGATTDITNTNLAKYSRNVSNSYTYVEVYGTSRSGKLYAMWYE